jgi:hypothetical protein
LRPRTVKKKRGLGEKATDLAARAKEEYEAALEKQKPIRESFKTTEKGRSRSGYKVRDGYGGLLETSLDPPGKQKENDR